MDKAKRALWGLAGGHFILDMYVSILIPLYPLIAQRLEINFASISLVIALGHGIASLLGPVFGYISDKIQNRFFMFWGLILVSIFMPLGFVAPNGAILTLCLILGITGNAFYHPQTSLIIKDFHKDSLALSKAIGIFLGLGTIGYSFGPYLSSYLAQNFGFKFIYIGIVGIICATFLLFFVPKPGKRESKSADNFLLALKDIVKNKSCVLLILLTILKATLIMSFGTYIPFLLKKYGFLTTQTGFIMTAFFIAGGLAMIFASRLEKKIKVRGMILASYLPLLPATVLSIVFLKYNMKLCAVFAFIAIGFFVLLAAGTILAASQKLIPNNSGTVSGIIQGFTLAIGSLILIPLGYIGQHYGISLVLILISTISAISALYCAKTELLD